MIRAIDKVDLIKVINDRPALISNLVNPPPAFVAACIFGNERCYSKAADKGWITLSVLLEFIKLIIKTGKVNYNQRGYIINWFPEEIRNQVPEKTIRELTKVYPKATPWFPNSPYDAWLEFLKEFTNDLPFKKIPKRHRTEDLLACRLAARHGYANDTVPEDSLTDTIVDKALTIEPYIFRDLPEKYQTTARMKRVFELDPHFELDQVIYKQETGSLGNIEWDQTLTETATQNKPCNLQYISPKYLTRTMYFRAIKEAPSLIDKVPAKFLDEEMLIEALCSGNVEYSKTTTVEQLWNKRKNQKPFWGGILNRDFAFKLVARDAQNTSIGKMDGLNNYIKYTRKTDQELTPDDWVKILTINPYAIRLTDKGTQTDAMVKAFLETASLDVIDSNYQALNLSKIKKEYTTLLIGTKSKFLQDIITRKSNPKPRVSHKITEPEKVFASVPMKDTVSIDLADADYLDVLKRMKQEG